MNIFDEIINKTFIIDEREESHIWTMCFSGDASRYTMTVIENCSGVENIVICKYRESMDKTRLYLDGPNLQIYKPYTWMISKRNAVSYDLWICGKDDVTSFRMVEDSLIF